MAILIVDIPNELRDFAEAKVRSGEFASLNDYLVSLIEAARERQIKIDQALVVGLESGPAKEWTSVEWEAIRERVVRRHR